MTYNNKPITEEKALETVAGYNGHFIELIKNPSEEVQLEAIKSRGQNIEYIKNPSEKVQLEAIKQSDWSIQHIENPSEEVQLEAIKQSGYMIEYIDNPSEEVQLEVVKQNGCRIQNIDNPSEEVILIAARDIREEILRHINIGSIRRLRKNTLLELLLIIEDKEFDRFYKRGLKELGAEELIERIERR